MSNDTNSMNIDKSISYGAKLRAAREAMGLEQKDIAAQLRLGERIIDMLESGHYSLDIPVTFIRGYIRSYSKLLQMSESDIAAALEPIQPIPTPQEMAPAAKPPTGLLKSKHYMQFSTYAIVATLAGMLGLWWFNHTPAVQQVTLAQEPPIAIPDVIKTPDNKQVTTTDATTPSAPPAPNATPPLASSKTENAATTVASAKPVAPPKYSLAKPASDEMDDDEPDNNNNRD